MAASRAGWWHPMCEEYAWWAGLTGMVEPAIWTLGISMMAAAGGLYYLKVRGLFRGGERDAGRRIDSPATHGIPWRASP